MIIVSNVRLRPDAKGAGDDFPGAVKAAIEETFGAVKRFEIIKKSLDARDKNDIAYVCSVAFRHGNESKFLRKKTGFKVETFKPLIYAPPRAAFFPKARPVVAGFGPAGIFCALVLAEAGFRPIVLERGKSVGERKKDAELFCKTGRLNEESNLQFGEGGAGAFSDGKLTTGVKDPRIVKIKNEFVENGAPPEIKYLAKPHIGADILPEVVANIRKKIQSLGGEILFSSKLTGFDKNLNLSVNGDSKLKTNDLVLALGHSAVNEFINFGLKFELKPYAVGFRIEHLQKDINMAQYGRDDGILPPAEYKLHSRAGNGIGVYTFCMCPGGVVAAAASQNGGVVTNGMSNYLRGGENANAAILFAAEGVDFQRDLEKRAFIAGGGGFKAPAQLVGDFLENKVSNSFGEITPTYPLGIEFFNLRELISKEAAEAVCEALFDFGRKLKNFDRSDAVLTGMETRTSSPIKVLRDDNFCSSLDSVYPVGEGAGVAGGIVSAAIDGIKCAERIVNKYN
jgi:uncharacterized FAD-dependent dehydrogenase